MAFIPPMLVALGAAAGTAGGAVSIASTVVGMLGTGASALAAHNSAEFQAKLAQQQGQMARDQASVKAGEIARDTKQRVSSARAGALQNGFELTGSMSDLLEQTERQGGLDYLTAVYEGKVQGIGANASAANYKRQASSALIGGALGMGAQALGGVSNLMRQRGAAINVSGT